MDREVKVRIDLLLDNQASLFDTLKAIQKEADKSEDKLKRLRNLQSTGNYQFLIQKEIDLVRQRNKEYLSLSTANQPFMEAMRRLDIERQIFDLHQKRAIESKNLPSITRLNRAELEDQVRALQQKRAIESANMPSIAKLSRAELEDKILAIHQKRAIESANMPTLAKVNQAELTDQILGIQQKRAMRGANRQQEIALLMEQDRDAKDRAALARQAHYQARYGRLGGVMSGVDRLTMSGFGYAAASGTVLGMAGSAGGTAVGTFTGALRRAAGEIGLMFVPAIMSAANLLHRFGAWVRDLNPVLKTVIGNVATYGLAISAAAKAVSVIGNLAAGVKEMFTGTALNGAAVALTTSAGHLSLAATRLGAGNVAGNVAGKAAGIGTGTVAVAGSGVAAGSGIASAAGIAGLSLVATVIAREIGHAIFPADTFIGRAGRNAENGAGYVANTFSGFGPVSNALGFAGGLANMFTGGGLIGMDGQGGGRRAPLSIPGYQSQQIDIFSLKDMIQQESLRDPNEQEKFGLAVREFQEAVRVWMTGMDPNRPAGIFDWLLG